MPGLWRCITSRRLSSILSCILRRISSAPGGGAGGQVCKWANVRCAASIAPSGKESTSLCSSSRDGMFRFSPSTPSARTIFHPKLQRQRLLPRRKIRYKRATFMAITIGQQLGSSEIVALLGKGGMGEVYRARDASDGPCANECGTFRLADDAQRHHGWNDFGYGRLHVAGTGERSACR